MDIYLIRHGESNWNVRDRVQGQSDPRLSKRGIEQAESVAERLSGSDFGFLYSSHLRRAYQTAEIIREKIALPIMVDKRLSEMNLGEWEGKCAKRLYKESPEFREWFVRTSEITPPKGESLSDFTDRVISAFGQIVKKEESKDRGIVVTHSGVISVFLAHLLGMEANKVWSISTENGSITILRINNPNFLLLTFNDTCHIRE
jgi:probable phosphoglycerate mutase